MVREQSAIGPLRRASWLEKCAIRSLIATNGVQIVDGAKKMGNTYLLIANKLQLVLLANHSLGQLLQGMMCWAYSAPLAAFTPPDWVCKPTNFSVRTTVTGFSKPKSA
jgi:hypothetical protein